MVACGPGRRRGRPVATEVVRNANDVGLANVVVDRDSSTQEAVARIAEVEQRSHRRVIRRASPHIVDELAITGCGLLASET